MKNLKVNLLISLFFICSTLYASNIYLSLKATDTSLETRRQFVLLKPFQIENKKYAKTFYDTQIIAHLEKNLNLSNLLKLTVPKEPSKILNTNDYLIQGKINYKTNIVNIKLEYIPEKEFVFEKTYKLNKKNIDKITNKISDDIYFHITGEKGLFSTKFAFAYTNDLKVKEIYVVDYNGNNLKKITNNKSISILPSWHPKKEKLLYTSYKNGNPDLFLIDLTTNKTKTISNKQGLNTSASFSPTTEEIILSMTENGNSEIVLLNQKGHFLSKITDNSWIDSSSCWSRDGTKILFISDQTGITQIYSKDITTDRITQLTFDRTQKDSIDYSNANDEIIYSCKIDKKWDICKLNIASKNIYRLTKNQGNNEDPSYSPDGKFISFITTRTGKRELFVMDVNGQNIRHITSLKGNIYSQNWSPFYE